MKFHLFAKPFLPGLEEVEIRFLHTREALLLVVLLSNVKIRIGQKSTYNHVFAVKKVVFRSETL